MLWRQQRVVYGGELLYKLQVSSNLRNFSRQVQVAALELQHSKLTINVHYVLITLFWLPQNPKNLKYLKQV